jgi:hypothetical protein
MDEWKNVNSNERSDMNKAEPENEDNDSVTGRSKKHLIIKRNIIGI